MVTDTLLDWLFVPFNAIVNALPTATYDAAAAVGSTYTNASTTLGWINSQQSLVTGGPGFIINGGLLATMLASWLTIETAILTIRLIVWIKKAVLV